MLDIFLLSARIKKVQVQHYRRLTDLNIDGLPESARLVVLAEPNAWRGLMVVGNPLFSMDSDCGMGFMEAHRALGWTNPIITNLEQNEGIGRT